MEAEIFDKETILDLMVNFIPLGILFFFIAAFAVYDPWGFDSRPSGLMFAIMGIMFVALVILTYVSAKAIAGDEKRAPVYAQGQAGLQGAKPLHDHATEADDSHADADAETAATDNTVDADADADADAETAATDNADADADAETDNADAESAGEDDTHPTDDADVDGEQPEKSDDDASTAG